MRKTIALTVVALGAALVLDAAEKSGNVDFSKTSGEPPVLSGWSLNPVKLSQEADPQKAAATLCKSADGEDVLRLTGGNTTMTHYFWEEFMKVKGNRDKVEISFKARGKGAVMLGMYTYSGQTWLATDAEYHSVPGEWREFKTVKNIPLKSSNGKMIDNIRIVIGCQAKADIEVKDIAWKLLSPDEEKAEIPSF